MNRATKIDILFPWKILRVRIIGGKVKLTKKQSKSVYSFSESEEYKIWNNILERGEILLYQREKSF